MFLRGHSLTSPDDKGMRIEYPERLEHSLRAARIRPRACLDIPHPVTAEKKASLVPGLHKDVDELLGIVLASERSHLYVKIPFHVAVVPQLRDDGHTLHAHPCHAFCHHAQARCGRAGKVNNAVVHEWTAVVYSYENRFFVVKMGDAYRCAEGQNFVRRRHPVLIIPFAAGGGFAVKTRTVPRSDALFHKSVGRFEWIIGFTTHGIRF